MAGERSLVSMPKPENELERSKLKLSRTPV
jgi:hypothetical protein